MEFVKESWLFPVIQSIHIIGLSLLVGTIALLDLRLLGVALRRHPVPDLAASLTPWTRAGLMTVFGTGPLLFGADLTRYLNNPAFLVKMVLLALALAAHFALHRTFGMSQRLAAAFSLILWTGVVLAGRAIADFDIRLV